MLSNTSTPRAQEHDYDYHTEAHDRAMQGGIDDVGLGVLFGLELYKYEFAGLLMHAEHLEAVYGRGPPHHLGAPDLAPPTTSTPARSTTASRTNTFAKIVRLYPHCRALYTA